MRAKHLLDATNLGNILITLGYASEQQIKAAICPNRRLGESLVAAKCITSEQLEEALLQQRVHRGSADAAELYRYRRAQRRGLMREVMRNLRDMTRLSHEIAEKLKT